MLTKRQKRRWRFHLEVFLGVPFISIMKDDGTKEGVVGFDKGKLNSVLGIQ